MLRPRIGSMVRLALTVVIVGIGAVLVAAGIAGTLSKPGSETSAAPTAPATPGPTTAAPTPGATDDATATPSLPSGDPVLVGAGDIARCDGMDDEATAALLPAGRADRDRGITEVVVGTGGAPLRGFEELAQNAIVRSSFAHGVLVLTLQPSGWLFRFESTDGSFSDQGRGTCH